MSSNFTNTLVKCLLDTLIFLEFTNPNLLNEDVAIELLEQISSKLQNMTEKEKQIFIAELENLKTFYPKNMQKFIENLPENIGLMAE